MLLFDRVYSLQIPSAIAFLLLPSRVPSNTERTSVGMSKTGFPLQCVRIAHANPTPGSSFKACMLCKNVPRTHASHSAWELAAI
eukprot:superscaffoldBa00003972_g18048